MNQLSFSRTPDIALNARGKRSRSSTARRGDAVGASSPIVIGRTAPEDLPGVAKIFAQSFPESLLHIFGRIPENEVLTEAFRVCLDAEPDAFMVARADGEVVGYSFTPSNLTRVWWTAFTRGHLFRWLWGWISGRLSIGWHPVRVLVANKVHFLRSALDRRYSVPARVLSIAVHPAQRGKGIARELLKRGLSYLEGRGVDKVRLEVRPGNTPARTMYEGLGFKAMDTTYDSQGDWLIMVKEFRNT